MIAPAETVYQSSDLVPPLRELLARGLGATNAGPEALSRLLFVLCYVSRRPEVFEVEAALEALQVEGELAA